MCVCVNASLVYFRIQCVQYISFVFIMSAQWHWNYIFDFLIILNGNFTFSFWLSVENLMRIFFLPQIAISPFVYVFYCIHIMKKCHFFFHWNQNEENSILEFNSVNLWYVTASKKKKEFNIKQNVAILKLYVISVETQSTLFVCADFEFSFVSFTMQHAQAHRFHFMAYSNMPAHMQSMYTRIHSIQRIFN